MEKTDPTETCKVAAQQTNVRKDDDNEDTESDNIDTRRKCGRDILERASSAEVPIQTAPLNARTPSGNTVFLYLQQIRS